MNREPNFLENLQAELSNGRLWFDRAVVLVYAVAAGLFVVAFTLLSEWAFSLFEHVHDYNRWILLVWTPVCIAMVLGSYLIHRCD